jgi:hypothetical protein
VMAKADGNQILVGEATHLVLNPQEKYMDRFRRYESVDKHGEQFTVYQYVSPHEGISCDPPIAFSPTKRVEPKFTIPVAYYVALVHEHHAFLLAKNEDPGRDYIATILLWFSATDASEQRFRPVHEHYHPILWGSEDATIEERYKHYRSLDVAVLSHLASLIQQEHLWEHREHFEGWEEGALSFVFVKASAIEKLRREWPGIAAEFGLATSSDTQS